MNNTNTDRDNPGFGIRGLLILIGVIVLGLFLVWLARPLFMSLMMDSQSMGMMGRQGMMGGGQHHGMMNNRNSRGMGQMMMDRMMKSEHCEVMLRLIGAQYHSIMGDSVVRKQRTFDRRIAEMSSGEMSQHCRSMHSSMMTMMMNRSGDTEPKTSESTGAEAEALEGWELTEQSREWIKTIRGKARVMDARGDDSVTVRVGVGELGLQFDPAVVRVDPGTTLNFVWTGKGGTHNVEFRQLDVRSPLRYQKGSSFQYTVEESGEHRYFCSPHEVVGMRGLVKVE